MNNYLNQNIFRFGPYFVDPVIAGLEADGKPFICAMDLIGCINFADDFVVAGSCSESLYGMCESLYRPDMVIFFSLFFLFSFF